MQANTHKIAIKILEERQTDRRARALVQSDVCTLQGGEAADIRYHEGCGHTLATQVASSTSVPLELLTGTDWIKNRAACRASTFSVSQSSKSNTQQRREIDADLLKCRSGEEARCCEQGAPRAKCSRAVCSVGVPYGWSLNTLPSSLHLETSNGDPGSTQPAPSRSLCYPAVTPAGQGGTAVNSRQSSGQYAKVNIHKTTHTLPHSVINTSSRRETITNHIKTIQKTKTVYV